MTTPRKTPSVWVSRITKLIAGEAHCEWASWFQAHYQYDKLPSDFDSVKWQVEHTGLLREQVAVLKADGYTTYVENQNQFKFPGSRGVILAGKPDIVAICNGQAIVIDCKTGKPKSSDHIQVLIYMLLLPHTHYACKGRELTGCVQYRNHSIPIPSTALDTNFRAHFRQVMELVGGERELERNPSYGECRFCDISKDDCPEKVDSPTPSMNINLENDLF